MEFMLSHKYVYIHFALRKKTGLFEAFITFITLKNFAQLHFIILLFDNIVGMLVTVYIYRNLYPMPFASVQEAYFNKRLR